MKISTFLIIGSAASGACVVASRLMADAEFIDGLPIAVQRPATVLRLRLLAAREVVAEAMREGRSERDAAERELTDDYLSRAQG